MTLEAPRPLQARLVNTYAPVRQGNVIFQRKVSGKVSAGGIGVLSARALDSE